MRVASCRHLATRPRCTGSSSGMECGKQVSLDFSSQKLSAFKGNATTAVDSQFMFRSVARGEMDRVHGRINERRFKRQTRSFESAREQPRREREIVPVLPADCLCSFCKLPNKRCYHAKYHRTAGNSLFDPRVPHHCVFTISNTKIDSVNEALFTCSGTRAVPSQDTIYSEPFVLKAQV